MVFLVVLEGGGDQGLVEYLRGHVPPRPDPRVRRYIHLIRLTVVPKTTKLYIAWFTS